METNNQNPNPLPRNCIYCVLTVARQIGGEWQVIKSEKAFTDPDKAEAFSKELNNKYIVPNTRPVQKMAVKVTTEHGEIACQCLASVYEMELVDSVSEPEFRIS